MQIMLHNSFMTQVPVIETSPVIRSANQWTGFYMIGNSVMKELKNDIECGHIRKFHGSFVDLCIGTLGIGTEIGDEIGILYLFCH